MDENHTYRTEWSHGPEEMGYNYYNICQMWKNSDGTECNLACTEKHCNMFLDVFLEYDPYLELGRHI